MRYCIWNNKGGVGKTFLTYCLSIEYAVNNPDKAVVAVDMCPQANVSEMLLGGNGKGEDNLSLCYDNGRTIASYIKSRYDRSRFGKIGSEISYFVRVSDYNENMPKNLYLLPGDVDLDICSSIIDYLASAPERNAWEKSRSFLSDLITVFEQDRKDSPVFFIDSNPSFANYTQLGLIASDRLIVPCTADSASIRGIYNILRLVFGVKVGDSVLEDNVFDTFYTKIQDIGGISPKIHSFILNKARTINRDASAAYRSHVAEIDKIIEELSANYADKFTTLDKQKRIHHMKDCNTLSPVLNYTGLAPSSLRNKKYEIYGKRTQANESQIQSFIADLHKIVAEIG
ncbi:MAG: ParA family protein [Planctomycetaceae bacterium]|jgi:cellulose biosynthesis protein BcsQ|nr:ParA family protein [Planctomycetaceae bacterium]